MGPPDLNWEGFGGLRGSGGYVDNGRIEWWVRERRELRCLVRSLESEYIFKELRITKDGWQSEVLELDETFDAFHP